MFGFGAWVLGFGLCGLVFFVVLEVWVLFLRFWALSVVCVGGLGVGSLVLAFCMLGFWVSGFGVLGFWGFRVLGFGF